MKKVCIVGCGAISSVHANAVENAENAELYAVCDINKERADRLGNKKNARVFYDFEEVLNCPEIDSVHICTPHYLHVEMAVKVLESGKYVVLEKPVAMNMAELERLKEADRKFKNRLCIILQNRTNNAVVTLIEELKNADKGEFLGSKAFLTWNRDEKYYAQDAWRGKWATEGGGLMINQAVHILDILCWLSGGVASVKATMTQKSLGNVIEVEDTADALFNLKNGKKAVFYATNSYGISSSVNLEMNFDKVTYRYADSFLYKIEKGSQPVVLADDKVDVKWKNYWGSGHKSAINAFYDAICGKNVSYITLDDGMNSFKVLFAMYESAKNNGLEIQLD